ARPSPRQQQRCKRCTGCPGTALSSRSSCVLPCGEVESCLGAFAHCVPHQPVNLVKVRVRRVNCVLIRPKGLVDIFQKQGDSLFLCFMGEQFGGHHFTPIWRATSRCRRPTTMSLTVVWDIPNCFAMELCASPAWLMRSEEHTSELHSREHIVCRP